MAHIPTGFVTHSRKVCSLYKRALRHVESVAYHFDEVRYRSIVLRAEFDKNKDLKDLRIAKHLIQKAEQQLIDEQHSSYKKFPESPGGCAYDRNHVPPDWVIDFWHPIEKSFYPKYFKLREQRKKEFEEFYKKHYLQPALASGTGHH